jgi:hypothetical protein
MGSFLTQQIRAGGTNYNYATAYSLAAEEFEDLRALRYADIADRSSTLTSGAMTFTVATAVDADTPAANMKQITINVSWRDLDGDKTIALHTIYTEIRR